MDIYIDLQIFDIPLLCLMIRFLISLFAGSKPLSLRHPILYLLRVKQRQAFRFLRWYLGKEKYAKNYIVTPLTYRYFRHQSKLIKPLGGTELIWQKNKVKNLSLAIKKLNNIIIYPHEHFSIWRLVCKPTKEKGYLEGMELSFGRARAGIGGGLCQLSNLIHWMALHTPLIVKERSQHSFDPFPDEGRVLPYGTGAALFYNYIDLILYNPTNQYFQVNLWLTDKHLEGEIRSSQPNPYKYHIFEKDHCFVQMKENFYRRNQIWRTIKTKGHSPILVKEEMLYCNFVKVMYDPIKAQLRTEENDL